MKTEEQRRLAASLAGKLRATHTQQIVGDSTSTYDNIFSAALHEISVDEIVSNVLQGPTEWAYQALRNMKNLSIPQRDALIKKSAEEPLSALHTLRFVPELGSHRDVIVKAAGALAQGQGEISGFYLNNKGSYNCAFTMYWANGGKIQPAAGSPKSAWVWCPKSGTEPVGQSMQAPCSDFALETSPLEAGNEVWMFLYVVLGQDIESPLRFTYNPGTANYACFTSSGCTQSDSLGLDKVAPPPASAVRTAATHR